MEKLKIQQFLIAKKREDTWQRALGTLGLRPTLIKEVSRTEIQTKHEPFKNGNVQLIKRGDFKTQKVKSIVLEVMHVEMVGNCYQVTLEDIIGDQIEATFHSDCKEYFAKQIRRGRILILQNVALFSLNPRNIYLIIKADCICHIVK